MSAATNLVPGDTNFERDIFLRDRRTGITERVNVDSTGGQSIGYCGDPSVSADGRFVAFWSFASKLVSGDTNANSDIFVRDRQNGTTERVSVDSAGNQGNGTSLYPTISADGRFVSFGSDASNLVSSDTNALSDIFVHDRQTGATERVSVDSSGAEANGQSYVSVISADGECVAFWSEADNLVPGDSNLAIDVFVHDRQAGVTERASVDSAGVEANCNCDTPSISADGRFVAFSSCASNLAPGDTNGMFDVFLRDRQSATTERVSVKSNGKESDDQSYDPWISQDGRFVSFSSYSTDLVPNDTNGVLDVFVHGPHLTIEADPPAPLAGATLTLTTWIGMASATTLLVITDVNGTPMFMPALVGSFDATGRWAIAATVPPGLSGVVISFETIGFVSRVKVDVSNQFAVSFQ
jgi:Tol biopolymer transport system component